MPNIEFGTETVVYNVIKIEGQESLGVDNVYEELLRLKEKAEDKEIIFEGEIERNPSIKWLMDMGVFNHNEDNTISIGENFKEVKMALKEKKQTSFWDDCITEE